MKPTDNANAIIEARINGFISRTSPSKLRRKYHKKYEELVSEENSKSIPYHCLLTLVAFTVLSEGKGKRLEQLLGEIREQAGGFAEVFPYSLDNFPEFFSSVKETISDFEARALSLDDEIRQADNLYSMLYFAYDYLKGKRNKLFKSYQSACQALQRYASNIAFEKTKLEMAIEQAKELYEVAEKIAGQQGIH